MRVRCSRAAACPAGDRDRRPRRPHLLQRRARPAVAPCLLTAAPNARPSLPILAPPPSLLTFPHPLQSTRPHRRPQPDGLSWASAQPQEHLLRPLLAARTRTRWCIGLRWCASLRPATHPFALCAADARANASWLTRVRPAPAVRPMVNNAAQPMPTGGRGLLQGGGRRMLRPSTLLWLARPSPAVSAAPYSAAPCAGRRLPFA